MHTQQHCKLVHETSDWITSLQGTQSTALHHNSGTVRPCDNYTVSNANSMWFHQNHIPGQFVPNTKLTQLTLLTAEEACPASGRGGRRAGGWWSEQPCPPEPAGAVWPPNAWLWYCPSLQHGQTACFSGVLHTAHTFTQHLALRSTAHDDNIKGAALLQKATILASDMNQQSLAGFGINT